MESAVEKLTRTLSNIERSIESLAALHAQVAQLRNPIEHETVSQMVEESEQVTGVESEQITGIDAPNEPNNTEQSDTTIVPPSNALNAPSDIPVIDLNDTQMVNSPLDDSMIDDVVYIPNPDPPLIDLCGADNEMEQSSDTDDDSDDESETQPLTQPDQEDRSNAGVRFVGSQMYYNGRRLVQVPTVDLLTQQTPTGDQSTSQVPTIDLLTQQVPTVDLLTQQVPNENQNTIRPQEIDTRRVPVLSGPRPLLNVFQRAIERSRSRSPIANYSPGVDSPPHHATHPRVLASETPPPRPNDGARRPFIATIRLNGNQSLSSSAMNSVTIEAPFGTVTVSARFEVSDNAMPQTSRQPPVSRVAPVLPSPPVQNQHQNRGQGNPQLQYGICSICYENAFQNRPHSTLCGHIFCHACITQAIRTTRCCPLCRTRLNSNSIHPLHM